MLLGRRAGRVGQVGGGQREPLSGMDTDEWSRMARIGVARVDVRRGDGDHRASGDRHPNGRRFSIELQVRSNRSRNLVE